MLMIKAELQYQSWSRLRGWSNGSDLPRDGSSNRPLTGVFTPLADPAISAMVVRR
jgi:hypothetical protein